MFQSSLRSSQDRAVQGRKAASLAEEHGGFPFCQQGCVPQGLGRQGVYLQLQTQQLRQLCSHSLLTVWGYLAKVQIPTPQVKPEICHMAMLVTVRALNASLTSLRPFSNACHAPTRGQRLLLREHAEQLTSKLHAPQPWLASKP